VILRRLSPHEGRERPGLHEPRTMDAGGRTKLRKPGSRRTGSRGTATDTSPASSLPSRAVCRGDRHAPQAAARAARGFRGAGAQGCLASRECRTDDPARGFCPVHGGPSRLHTGVWLLLAA
jgi:hypothetical protein